MFFRVYLVIGSLSRVESLADTLTGWAQWGPLNFDDKTAFVPLYSKSLNGQTILDLDPEAAAGNEIAARRTGDAGCSRRARRAGRAGWTGRA